MGMTWTIVGIVALGVAAGIAAIGLLLACMFVPVRRLARSVRAGEIGGRCPCCAYSTEGLEEDRCPECGRWYGEATARLARRRRIALGVVGLVLGVVAVGSYPAADAARFGAVHPLPSVVLVQLLRVAPSWHTEVARELQGRADAGQLGEWTCAMMASACSHVIAGEPDRATRRDAAWLLTRVVGHTDAKVIGLMVQDKDSGVRAFGVEALRLSGGSGVGSTSARLHAMAIGDSSEMVRKRADDVHAADGAGGSVGRRAAAGAPGVGRGHGRFGGVDAGRRAACGG
jgi:hypothetical protein